MPRGDRHRRKNFLDLSIGRMEKAENWKNVSYMQNKKMGKLDSDFFAKIGLTMWILMESWIWMQSRSVFEVPCN